MRRIILALVIAALTPAVGHAWGSKGHKVVAALSLEYLSDAARAGVQSLLGADDDKYINAAVWADQIRNDRPQTKPWHFVDIPNNAPGYDPARDCKNQNCAIARIDLFAKQLADRKARQGEARRGAEVRDPFRRRHPPAAARRRGRQRPGRQPGVRDGRRHHRQAAFRVGHAAGQQARLAAPEEIAENLESRITEDDVKKLSRGNAEGLGRGVAQDRARFHLRAEQRQGARRGQPGRAAERLSGEGAADRALAALARRGPPRDGAQQGVREAEGKGEGKGK